ncbi:MAG: carboxypeptidase-like regulatory domain-containing protein [Acidobacteria bacterium]|nr:carboxypeptidase-like regulatory domain-containing protein [Acidobacteriota bacterium]
MIRGGVVEGNVVDQHNEPRSRVRVRLSSYESSEGERKLFPVGRAETDDRGRFRLFDIPPGSYYLSAAPPFFYGRMGGEERSFPPVYYPGVLSPLEAAKVQVAAGEEVGGFYFTLVETRSYSASGRVLTAEGKPAHAVWIISRRESGEAFFAGMESSANTDLQGEFKVTGLLPGRHRLHARAGEDDKPRMASTVVEVADRDIEGLTLVLGAGAEVTGRIVTDRQDSDLDWRRIWLDMDPIGESGRISFGGENARVEEDFTFKITNLPEASYRLVVRLPPGNHYVESIRLRTEELIDRPIEVRSADRLDEVEIHVSSEGAQVGGVVEKEEAREVAQGATVLVFAADSDFRGPNSRFTRTTQSDQRGRFSLKGLAPGEYLLCAVADHESGFESDLDYLSSLERDSERIELSSGQTMEQSLVALPAPNINGR